MESSTVIASLLGPVLVAVSVLEAKNSRIWTTVTPSLTFLNGMVFFATGVAVLRFHHHWAADWTVLVTLSGWLLALVGLGRMAFPEAVRTENRLAIYAATGTLTLLGLVLTAKGWL